MSDVSRRTILGWLSTSGLTLAAGVFASGRAAAAEPTVTVYAGGTLIDGTGARPRPNATIVTLGERIVAVGSHRGAVPAEVRVVDLRGKYVLPGLIDMHAHTLDLERIFLPLYLANGVTSIREMLGRPFHHSMRHRIEAGELRGPRIVLASNAIDGAYPFFPGVVSVRTADEARAAVRQAKAEGADFIKVFSHLSEDAFAAIADEAHRLALPFAGHLPDEVRSERGIELGMRTMEHPFGLPIDASILRDQLRAQIAATPIDPADPAMRWFIVRMLEREALKTYDRARAQPLFEGMRRRGIAFDPTMHVGRIFCFPPERIVDDPLVRYVPPWLKQDWDANLFARPWTPEDIAEGQRAWENTHRFVSHVNAAGVAITAGTDCGLPPYGIPGFSLHDELRHLANAGLTPMQAILAGTRDAARAAGIAHLAGTVQVGKVADLLVVDRDPLADIGHTRLIHAVVHRARLITRAERARMLAEVEEVAQTTPRPPTPFATTAACC